MGKHRIFAILLLAILGMLLAAMLLTPEVSQAGEHGAQAVKLDKISVVGSRRPVRTTADAPSAVDIIDAEDLSNQGTTQVPELMRKLVPSYNVGTQPISDAATFIRPANLRGLAADQTLVLVNGKRRHRAAVISWLGFQKGRRGPTSASSPRSR